MSQSNLIRDLMRDEGQEPFVYDDATGEKIVKGYTLVGNPTIGIGRRLDFPCGITPGESIALLHYDLIEVESSVRLTIPWAKDLPEPAYHALLNMRFNLGMKGLLNFKKMLAALKVRNFELAADEALDSAAARRLPQRYERIAMQFRSCL
jgi:lysozyme